MNTTSPSPGTSSKSRRRRYYQMPYYDPDMNTKKFESIQRYARKGFVTPAEQFRFAQKHMNFPPFKFILKHGLELMLGFARTAMVIILLITMTNFHTHIPKNKIMPWFIIMAICSIMYIPLSIYLIASGFHKYSMYHVIIYMILGSVTIISAIVVITKVHPINPEDPDFQKQKKLTLIICGVIIAIAFISMLTTVLLKIFL